MLNLLRGHGRVTVPDDLHAIMRTDHAAESAPEDAGLSRKSVQRIWSAVEQLYRTGLHPAITLVLRRHGKLVLKRSIGCLRGNAPGEDGPMAPLNPDAPICLFSASKAISSLLVHKLVEDGKLRLDDRVSAHIPEFAAQGKEHVTLRQLMSHRAGIPKIPIRDPQPDLLMQWDTILQALCAAKPDKPAFERQAYHAITSGFIIGELVRRVSGRELPEVLREWLAEPLGCRYLTYGLKPELRALAPANVNTGPRAIWPITSFARRILGVTLARCTEVSNLDPFLSAVIPAGNIYASADDACRVFQMLLNSGELDGRRVFRRETVREALRPIGKIQLDGMLGVPMRFSAGFMLGENPFGLYGPKCPEAFGHLGFLSIICWADPQRDISVAFLNTGKSVAPANVLGVVRVLGAIARACPPLNA